MIQDINPHILNNQFKPNVKPNNKDVIAIYRTGAFLLNIDVLNKNNFTSTGSTYIFSSCKVENISFYTVLGVKSARTYSFVTLYFSMILLIMSFSVFPSSLI